jgi:hypothetical protein
MLLYLVAAMRPTPKQWEEMGGGKHETVWSAWLADTDGNHVNASAR